MNRTCFQVAALALASAGCLDASRVPMGTIQEEATDIDRVDATCTSGPRTLEICGPGVVENKPDAKKPNHVLEPAPITYADSPPSSGDHRPAWGRWGEYDYLPPQRWLHNLEHGGLAFLYDPCAPIEVINALRAYVRALPEDDSGPFRWVLTPYPDLPTPVAAVAWEWTWQAECVDIESLDKFVTDHYRQAPEDFGADGSYGTGWLGR